MNIRKVAAIAALSVAAAVSYGAGHGDAAPPRDKVEWPTNPTARDLRVRGVNVRKFLALGRCEAGRGDGYGGVRWHTPPGWRWQGAYGMYYATHQSVGHPYGSDAGSMTWQEQTLVAERVRIRYGIHAWGAASCYIRG